MGSEAIHNFEVTSQCVFWEEIALGATISGCRDRKRVRVTILILQVSWDGFH